MSWTNQVDNYCERIDPSFWSEPVNAATNAAFVVAAIICWGMLGGKKDPGARVLTILLALIGIGSFLFHTFATGWAGVMDVVPILLFILAYVYLATVRLLGLPIVAGVAAVVLFVPYSAALSTVVSAVAGPLNGSVSYVPVPILILGYAAASLRRNPNAAGGLAIGAGLLCLSLVFRTIDEAVCSVFPFGTHFLWHILNGALLGWMIFVLHRHGRPSLR